MSFYVFSYSYGKTAYLNKMISLCRVVSWFQLNIFKSYNTLLLYFTMYKINIENGKSWTHLKRIRQRSRIQYSIRTAEPAFFFVELFSSPELVVLVVVSLLSLFIIFITILSSLARSSWTLLEQQSKLLEVSSW